MTFFDELASLCAKEMAAAERADDSDRKAAVIEGLSTVLGRTIARGADGEATKIDLLLTGSENLIAEEAASFAKLLELRNLRPHS